MKFFQEFKNYYTIKMSSVFKAILFLEDFKEEAECDRLYAEFIGSKLVVNPEKCNSEVFEALNHYSNQYEIQVETGRVFGEIERFYWKIVELYAEGLRPVLRKELFKSPGSKIEYFLLVSPLGDGVLLEGEMGKVKIPWIESFFTAHTHPEETPTPSFTDLETIVKSLTLRSIGHSIEGYSRGMVIFRIKPLTVEQLFYLKNVKRGDLLSFIERLNRVDSIRITYL
ncbi:MAG: hypothetical protein QXP68_00060 [Thermosphaera sp.]